MQCPKCQSTHIRTCGRQFIKNYDRANGYDEQTKQECLTAYVNGMGFRAIERLKGVHYTTIIHWVKSVETRLSNATIEHSGIAVSASHCTPPSLQAALTALLSEVFAPCKKH